MKPFPAVALVSVLAAGAALSAAPAHAAAPLPWIEDDYAQAVKDARSRHVPIFLEAWAPW